MKITILGTAAAEGWPALFCNCAACAEARARGGKNIRTRSSIQLGTELKIDFPPDSLYHSYRQGVGFEDISFLLFTHAHYDHLDGSQLSYLIPPFALQNKIRGLRIFGTDEVIRAILPFRNWNETDCPDLLNRLEPFMSLKLGPYSIDTIKAVHGTEGQSLNFLITRDNRNFLYASDTGYYGKESWEYLKGKRADLVITECTGGPDRLEYGTHMGFPNVRDFRKKAEEIGLTDNNTRWIITHFSHTGGMLHEELEALVRPYGFETAWDGMELTL